MSALKDPVQIDYKKACSVWKKQQYQHSADIFVEKVFNPFHGTSLSILPEIHQKTRGFS